MVPTVLAGHAPVAVGPASEVIVSSVPLHPALVHLPLALAVLAPLGALAALVAWRRGWAPPRVWAAFVALQALLVAAGVASLRSGEEDEERVESVVSEKLIHEHEEAAELFVLVAGVVLGVGLVPLVSKREEARRWAAGIAAVGTVVVAGLGYRAGLLGGELVYRHGAASAHVRRSTLAGEVPPQRAGRTHEEDEGDDDD